MNNLQDRYLLQAISIADNILLNAHRDNDGYYWECLGLNANGIVSTQKSSGLYKGTSGVLLFLNALYKVTKNEEYLSYILGGGNWLYRHSAASTETCLALFTGKTGVAYCLIILGESLDKPELIKKGHELALDMVETFSLIDENADLLVGWAGVLSGLTLIYDRLKDRKILPPIYSCIEKITNTIKIGKKGIFWGGDDNISGLCGLSHGNSGIALTLLQTGIYFKLDYLIDIATLAFEYENNHFNKENSNWPDFRKNLYSEDDKRAFIREYLSNNLKFFNTPGDMLAWCHGAPGILLAHLRASDLLLNSSVFEQYDKPALLRLEREMNWLNSDSNYTICHGAIGYGLVFLEKYRKTKNKKYKTLALKIADLSIDSFKSRGSYVSGGFTGIKPDVSLFNGISGIGFYYLMTAGYYGVEDLLFYPLSYSSAPSKNVPKRLKERTAGEIIYNKLFPRTINLLSKLGIAVPPPLVNDFLKKNTPNHFYQHLLNLLRPLIDIKRVVKEVSKIEKSILHQSEKHPFCFTKAKILALDYKNMQVLELDRDNFEALILTSSGINAIRCNWDWSLPKIADNLSLKPQTFYRVITEQSSTTQDLPINLLSYLIINTTQKEISVKDCINVVFDKLDVDGTSEKHVKDLITKQIKSLLKAKLLLVV
jgi:hypothetical protein